MPANDHDHDDDQGRDQDAPAVTATATFSAPPRKAPAKPSPAAQAKADPAADHDHDEPSPEDIKAELERTRRALAAANKSDKERRLRLDELEKAEQERRDASLGEAEKLNRAKAEAERKAADADRKANEAARALEELKLERLIEGEARKQRFKNPELAYKLVDRSAIEHDPDLNRWEGIAKAVETLAKSYPDLILQKNAGPGSPPRDEHPGNTARRAGRLSGRSGEDDPFVSFANEAISYERM